MNQKSILIKLPESEKEKIYEEAKKRGLAASELIRQAIARECELCKPDEEIIEDDYDSDKIHINVKLDREAVDKVDKHAAELGTSRSRMIRRMIMEKHVVTCNINIDLNDLFYKLVDELEDLNTGNKNILMTIEKAGSFFTEHDREIVRNNSNKVADAVIDMQKQIWRSNTAVKDVAKKEIRKILYDEGIRNGNSKVNSHS